MIGFNTASGRYCCNDLEYSVLPMTSAAGFNTASGRYCCNGPLKKRVQALNTPAVSIPQAVGTVAT